MHVELVTAIFRDGTQVSGDLMADVAPASLDFKPVPARPTRVTMAVGTSGRYLRT